MEKGTKRRVKKLGTAFFVLYVLVLVYLLFFSEGYGRVADAEREYRYNLVPFVSSWITSIVRLIKKPDNMIKKPFRIFPVITGRINPYGTNPSTFPKTFVKSANVPTIFR